MGPGPAVLLVLTFKLGTDQNMLLRNGDLITWDSRLGCPRAGILPALQKLDVIKSSFLTRIGLLPWCIASRRHSTASTASALLPWCIASRRPGRARVLWILYQVQLETCRFP